LRQLAAKTALCRITTLELRSSPHSCVITGPHAEWLEGGVLAHFPALGRLTHLMNLMNSLLFKLVQHELITMYLHDFTRAVFYYCSFWNEWYEKKQRVYGKIRKS
jgi:hypothetical protein